MKAMIETADLKKAIVNLTQVKQAKNNPLILKSIRIRSNDECLILESSNLDQTTKAKVPAVCENPGTYCVKLEDLSKIVKLIKADDIWIESQGENLSIVTDGVKYALPTQDAERFPDVSMLHSDERIFGCLTFPAPAFLDMLQKMKPFLSKESNRPIFTGINVKVKGENRIAFCATDGKKILEIQMDAGLPEHVPADTVNFILHGGIIDQFAKLKGWQDITLNLVTSKSAEKPRVTAVILDQVGTYDFQFRSTIIQGRFPDYEKCFPDTPFESVFDRKTFLDAVKKMEPSFKSTEAKKIRLEIHEHKTVFSAGSEKDGFTTEIEIESNHNQPGNILQIAFNGSFLKEMLNTFSDESLVLRSSGNNQHGCLIQRGDLGNDKTILIMPLRNL